MNSARTLLKSKRAGTVVYHLFLVALVLAFVGGSLKLPAGAALLPLMVGSITVALLLLSLASEFVPALAHTFEGGVEFLLGGKGGSAVQLQDEQAGSLTLPFMQLVIGGSWLAFFIVLAIVLGIYAATALFVSSYLSAYARYPWWQVLLYAAVLLLIEWYGLEVLFEFDLWKGAIFELVPGFIGGDVLPPFL